MPRAIRPLLAALSLSLLVPIGSPLQAAEPGTTGEAASDQGAALDPSAADPDRPAQTERSADAARALSRHLPSQEQQLLQAGDESFLALWLPANTAEAHGVVVLVAGAGESADWPKVLGPLRRRLPDGGWHSLSLSLPDPQGSLPPAPETRSANAPAATAAPVDVDPGTADEPLPGADAAPAEPSPQADQPAADADERHARRIKQRIAAALQLARQQQAKQIVLLGHGSGGYWSMRYLSEEQPADVRSLLLVDVKPAADASPGLDELQASLKLTTGDFYYQDRPLERSAATERAQASKRQKHPAYTQVALKALPGNPEVEQEQLYRRLRGWLTLQLPAG